MRALLVANPAATTTTRKVRDVLVRALSSELKVDVAETTHRGPARELGAPAAAAGATNVFSRALGRSRDPVEATGEILDSLRAGRTRLVSLGTASAHTGEEG